MNWGFRNRLVPAFLSVHNEIRRLLGEGQAASGGHGVVLIMTARIAAERANPPPPGWKAVFNERPAGNRK